MFSRNILHDEFVIAAGNGDEIIKIAKVIELMFDFELKIQSYGEEKFILLAEVKEIKNINKRRDSVLKATGELIKRYDLSCELGDYHGFVMPEDCELDIKGYSLEQAINDFNLDQLFSNGDAAVAKNLVRGDIENMSVSKILKEAYRKQFESYYEKTSLTDEQLEVYMNFFLGKETDIQKVADICEIPFKESFSTRESFKKQFKFIYDKQPTEEQLDMFISFMLGVVTDLGAVVSVCQGESLVNESQRQAD